MCLLGIKSAGTACLVWSDGPRFDVIRVQAEMTCGGVKNALKNIAKKRDLRGVQNLASSRGRLDLLESLK